MCASLYAQHSEKSIKDFFEAFVSDSASLHSFIDNEDNLKSKRLGITYENEKNKFLISYDVDPRIKEAVKRGELTYDLKIEKIDYDFSKVHFKIEKINYSKIFYFRNSKFISPTTYFTKDWNSITSEYFTLYYSNPTLVNEHSIKELDNFVESMCDVLNVSLKDKKELAAQKINYFLCKDAEEIEKITGFNTRGLYIIAFDEIISTYNFHVHEICHLLINFRLKHLPLYTLPIYQEGFATLYGGRGGLGANVLSDIGYFLLKSNFLSIRSILSKKDFAQEDASLTYPVASLFNSFLINELKIEKYLELYKQNSGDEKYISTLQTNLSQFESRFNKFLDEYTPVDYIKFDFEPFAKVIAQTESIMIKESNDFYEFETTSNLSFGNKNHNENFVSKKFLEIYPDHEYNNQKYLITVNKSEINVYNLYTNNLIASYSSGFSLNPQNVKSDNGVFKFAIRKIIFDEDLKALQLSPIIK